MCIEHVGEILASILAPARNADLEPLLKGYFFPGCFLGPKRAHRAATGCSHPLRATPSFPDA